MKKYLKYVIFAVTMFLALHNTFGQRATSIEQIIQTPNSIPFNMVFSSENEITTFQISNSTTGRYSVNRYSTDGQPLGSVIPWSDEALSTMRIHDVELYSEPNGGIGLYYVATRLGTDTTTFHKITITEDMDLIHEDFQWYGLDFPDEIHDGNSTKVFVGKNREVLLSYNDKILDSVHIVRFDADGEVISNY